MESKNNLLEIIQENSTIKEYKATDKMLFSKVYDCLKIDKKFYLVLCNGKKVSDNYEINKGDNLLVMLKIANNLEKVI